MRVGPRKILHLLAASNISEREIQRFFDWIKTDGSSVAIQEIIAIRDAHETPDVTQQVPRRKESPWGSKILASPAEMVIQLLREDAKLGPSQAMAMLRQSLMSDGVPSDAVPELRPRESFRHWVEALLQSIPESIVLQHASRVRNTVVHEGRADDWPIRPGEGDAKRRS